MLKYLWVGFKGMIVNFLASLVLIPLYFIVILIAYPLLTDGNSTKTFWGITLLIISFLLMGVYLLVWGVIAEKMKVLR